MTLDNPASATARSAAGLPKISCLMVTRGELFPARFAIACYRRQIYPNRELVIVCDQPGNEVGRWVATLNDPTIRYIETGKAVLGALRNLSVEQATGELVCQWDDDDLYHPRRLALQQRQLARSGRAAHFLTQWTLWWPRRRLIGLSHLRLWEGSMLVRRELLPKYPEMVRAEDTPVLMELLERHKVAATRMPGLYIYVVHGTNTWHTAHFESMFANATGHVPPERYDAELEKLAKAVPIKRYAQEIEGRNVYTLSG